MDFLALSINMWKKKEYCFINMCQSGSLRSVRMLRQSNKVNCTPQAKLGEIMWKQSFYKFLPSYAASMKSTFQAAVRLSLRHLST